MGSDQPVPVCSMHGKIVISHLCFADDLLLFVEATIDQIEVIMGCLDKLCVV